MKFLYCFSLCLAVSAISNAQPDSANVQRYIFEVGYQLDSTDADKISTENFFLDVSSDNSSRFASEGKLIRDSVMRYWESQLAAGAKSVNITKTISSKFNFEIVKDAAGKVTYRNNAGGGYYYYNEDLANISWKILQGFEDYHGMKTQKATANYAGRTWYVLFTNAIPLIEGPYKFKNLPGFVVKAWDSRNHYTFSFVQSKALTVFFDTKLSPKSMKVTKAQLNKAINNYRNQPLSFLGQVKFSGGDAAKVEMEKARMEKLKKENNWIELTD